MVVFLSFLVFRRSLVYLILARNDVRIQTMKNDANLHPFAGIDLLDGLSDSEVQHVFTCLQARRKRLEKGEILFSEGSTVDRFAIVLSGAVHVIRYTIDGRGKIEETVGAGGLVGAAQVCASEPFYLANAVAAQESELLVSVAKRGVKLQRKLYCLSQPTTSEKLMAFLRLAQSEAGTETFGIPYTRQELADYLNVARAALSTEIGKLVKAGVIETDHKAFRFPKRRT